MAACASATVSFVPSPQDSTAPSFAMSDVTYTGLSPGRQLARTRSEGNTHILGHQHSALVLTTMRGQARIVRTIATQEDRENEHT